MVAGCGISCIKYILVFVNLLFFFIGGAGIGFGLYSLKSELAVLAKIDSSGKIGEFNGVGALQGGAIALVVGGTFLFIIGFAGCCGAVKEIKCLLGVYIAIVLLVVIAEVVAAALAIAFKDTIEEKLKEGLVQAVKAKYDGDVTSDNPFSRAFDFAQVQFDCCGVNNYTDFDNSPWYTHRANTSIKVPNTCCKLKDKNLFYNHNNVTLDNPNCPTTAPGNDNPNTGKPCYQAIRDWAMTQVGNIIGIACGTVAIEIIAVIFACWLYYDRGNLYQRIGD